MVQLSGSTVERHQQHSSGASAATLRGSLALPRWRDRSEAGQRLFAAGTQINATTSAEKCFGRNANDQQRELESERIFKLQLMQATASVGGS